MEVPEKTGRSHDSATNREPSQGSNLAMTGTKGLVEGEYDFQVDEYSEGEAAGDEQWDSESDLPSMGAGEAEGPQRGPPQHLPGSQVRPAQLAGAGRPRARLRPRVNPDRQW
jgi:hypothetical protein